VAAPVLDRSVLVNSTIKTVAKNLTEARCWWWWCCSCCWATCVRRRSPRW
jgi:hypothetical protein